MAKTSKKAPAKKSDKLLTLFQNKVFTLVFFLVTFSIIGGAVFLWKSSAGSRATVAITGAGSGSGCRISGKISVSGINSVRAISRYNSQHFGGYKLSGSSYGKKFDFTIRFNRVDAIVVQVYEGGRWFEIGRTGDTICN